MNRRTMPWSSCIDCISLLPFPQTFIRPSNIHPTLESAAEEIVIENIKGGYQRRGISAGVVHERLLYFVPGCQQSLALRTVKVDAGGWVIAGFQTPLKEAFEAVFDVVALEFSGVCVLGCRHVVAEAASSLMVRGGLDDCWRRILLVACAAWAIVRWLRGGFCMCGVGGWGACWAGGCS